MGRVIKERKGVLLCLLSDSAGKLWHHYCVCVCVCFWRCVVVVLGTVLSTHTLTDCICKAECFMLSQPAVITCFVLCQLCMLWQHRWTHIPHQYSKMKFKFRERHCRGFCVLHLHLPVHTHTHTHTHTVTDTHINTHTYTAAPASGV